jgi:hypothetical protein
MNARVAGCAYRIPARPYSLVKPGRKGEGPGRENSLASLSASLTNSLSHIRRIGATRPVVLNYCELTTVTVLGLNTAASACRRDDTIGRTPTAREYRGAVDAPVHAVEVGLCNGDWLPGSTPVIIAAPLMAPRSARRPQPIGLDRLGHPVHWSQGYESALPSPTG